jgi:hypothetical protein
MNAVPRTGAQFARGASKQNYETPADFIRAVETRFGRLTVDLACSPENAKAPDRFYEDRLPAWPREGLLWLNPPFSNIAPWASRCAAWQPVHGARL